jgi:hypothetical protein
VQKKHTHNHTSTWIRNSDSLGLVIVVCIKVLAGNETAVDVHDMCTEINWLWLSYQQEEIRSKRLNEILLGRICGMNDVNIVIRKEYIPLLRMLLAPEICYLVIFTCSQN